MGCSTTNGIPLPRHLESPSRLFGLEAFRAARRELGEGLARVRVTGQDMVTWHDGQQTHLGAGGDRRESGDFLG